MKIRWSPDAAADLEAIIGYINKDDPAAAHRVGREIYERLSVLGAFPRGGRPGRVDGTRELPLPPLPFIVIYRVLDRVGTVEIVNIIHGAQLFP